MKILQVTPYFYPRPSSGGTARAVFELSKALATRGHEITVYTTDTLNSQKRIPYTQKKINNLEIFCFKNISHALSPQIKLPITPSILGTKHFVKTFDLIHLHEYRTFQNIVISHYARKYNIPCVLTLHGSLSYHKKFITVKKKFDFLFGKRILQKASRILVLSKKEKQEFIKMSLRGSERERTTEAISRDPTKYYPYEIASSSLDKLGTPRNDKKKKIIQIKNGVNLEKFRKPIPKNLFRQKFRLGSSPFILFLGRINPIKGLDFLIDVFSKVDKELPQAKLVLAGPDENYQKKLEKKIQQKKLEQKIIFTGPLFGKIKLAALHEANLFVYPSQYEAFPLSPLEATASKTPVIISDQCEGIADLFSQKKLGLVLAYNDVNLWKEKILKTLKNPDQKLIENAYQYLANYLTWGKIAQDHEQIYRKTLNSTSS